MAMVAVAVVVHGEGFGNLTHKSVGTWAQGAARSHGHGCRHSSSMHRQSRQQYAQAIGGIKIRLMAGGSAPLYLGVGPRPYYRYSAAYAHIGTEVGQHARGTTLSPSYPPALCAPL